MLFRARSSGSSLAPTLAEAREGLREWGGLQEVVKRGSPPKYNAVVERVKSAPGFKMPESGRWMLRRGPHAHPPRWMARRFATIAMSFLSTPPSPGWM